MAITIIHGIQQNILQMVSFEKSSIVAVLQVLPLLVAAFTFKIITSIAQLVDPFYCLQCKFIVSPH